MEERLEVAHRGRHPGRLLDLQRELAGRRPIGARRDGEDRPAARRDRPAIASAPASSAAPSSSRSRTVSAVDGIRPTGAPPRRRPPRSARRSRSCGTSPGPSRRSRRRARAWPRRRPGNAALPVISADPGARARRPPPSPGSWRRSRPRARSRSRARRSAGRARARTPAPPGPRPAPRAGLPSGSPRRMIDAAAWAACSLVPQPVVTIGAPLRRGLADRSRKPSGGTRRIGQAIQQALGEVRLGRDHVRHVPRRAGPDRGFGHLRPRVGGGRQGNGRVEVGHRVRRRLPGEISGGSRGSSPSSRTPGRPWPSFPEPCRTGRTGCSSRRGGTGGAPPSRRACSAP